jgi:hypothetical protein
MRLFRDEEHVRRAYDELGALFAPAQLWTLAQRWYGDRLDPDWTPHTRERNQADLAAAGLTGEFFELPQASR